MVATATDEHDPTTRRLIASRQLQALSALGFTTAELAARSGYCTTLIKAWRTGTRPLSDEAVEDVDTLFDWLHTTLPAGPDADRTVAAAVRAGWVTPGEWVDIRDPHDRPDSQYRRRNGARHRIHPEDLADLEAMGLCDERIAARLGVTVGALERRRYRAAAALTAQAAGADTPRPTPTDSDNTVSAPGAVLSVVARHSSGDQTSRTPERRETRGEAA